MRPDRPNGFLLAEALVALAIVALMAGVVFETLGQLGQTAAGVAQRRAALLLARSVLAAATVPGPVSPIGDTGRDGPLAWRIQRRNWAGASPVLRLEHIDVAITPAAGGVPLVHLSGLRIAQ